MTKAILPHLAVFALLMLPGAAAAQRSATPSYTDERIGRLQQSVAELVGRLEQLQKQNQQIQQQLEKMRTSVESRLDRLEKGPTSKPTPTPRPKPTKP